MSRIASVCTVCHMVTWKARQGLVLNALKGSRRWWVCPECKEDE